MGLLPNASGKETPLLGKGGVAARLTKCCEASEAAQTGAKRKRDSAQH